MLRRQAYGAPKPPPYADDDRGPAKPSADPVAPGGTPKTIEPFQGTLPVSPNPFSVKVLGEVQVVSAPNRRPIIGVANHVDANAIMAAPANQHRSVLVLLNSSPKTVYMLGGKQDDPGIGFPIAPGGVFTVEHQKAVYTVCPTATNASPALVNTYAEVEAG